MLLSRWQNRVLVNVRSCQRWQKKENKVRKEIENYERKKMYCDETES